LFYLNQLGSNKKLPSFISNEQNSLLNKNPKFISSFNSKTSSFENGSYSQTNVDKSQIIAEKIRLQKSLKEEREKKYNIITPNNKKIISNKEFVEQFSEEINNGTDNLYKGKNLNIVFSKK
jgi:hypothetical protein